MNIIEANVATPDARVAITIARFNNFINDSLLEGAIDALKRIGQVKDENITVVWVPGAYELPLAADALAKTGKYDAVIATYHDQGLIPFKTLSFGNGVNYTAGLNKIRTSPDHGTAYEIAGKGVANHESFKEAVYLAIDIFKKRNDYQELIKNPLKTKEKQL